MTSIATQNWTFLQASKYITLSNRNFFITRTPKTFFVTSCKSLTRTSLQHNKTILEDDLDHLNRFGKIEFSSWQLCNRSGCLKCAASIIRWCTRTLRQREQMKFRYAVDRDTNYIVTRWRYGKLDFKSNPASQFCLNILDNSRDLTKVWCVLLQNMRLNIIILFQFIV